MGETMDEPMAETPSEEELAGEVRIPEGPGQMSDETEAMLHRLIATPISEELPLALLQCHDQLKFLFNRLHASELEWQFLMLAVFLSGIEVKNAPFNGMFSTLARQGGADDLDSQVDDLCSDLAALAERLRKLEARLEDNQKPGKAEKKAAKKAKAPEEQPVG